MFGAGTDYALLLVARYREELRRHDDRHEAMAVALHRAGPAIIASGATVAVGMLCLLFAETNSTKGLGPVAAIGIVVGLLVMLTLLPALLVTVRPLGLLAAAGRRCGSAEPTEHRLLGPGRRGRSPAGRAPTWIVTCAGPARAGARASPQLNATGLTNEESFSGKPDVDRGRGGARPALPGAAAGSPVAVIATRPTADEVRAVFAGDDGHRPATVTAPVVKGDTAYVEGTLTDPAGQPGRLRHRRPACATRVHAVPGADALVGGSTAINLDVQRAARHDNNLIIPIVLVVVLVILALLLRAVVAPLLLIGDRRAVVRRGARHQRAGLQARLRLRRRGHVVPAVRLRVPGRAGHRLQHLPDDPGARGGAPGTAPGAAALIGLAATGGVITSAGLVLAGTFAVLGTLPLVAFAEIGFAVALGVLLDTLVVRSVLVTALNLDIGRRMWWPSRLSKDADVAPAEALESVRASR